MSRVGFDCTFTSSCKDTSWYDGISLLHLMLIFSNLSLKIVATAFKSSNPVESK